MRTNLMGGRPLAASKATTALHGTPILGTRSSLAIARELINLKPIMTTTTIRIDDSLKVRIATAADSAGKTAHAFILDAISQTVEQVELDNEFNDIADERRKGILASG